MAVIKPATTKDLNNLLFNISGHSFNLCLFVILFSLSLLYSELVAKIWQKYFILWFFSHNLLLILYQQLKQKVKNCRLWADVRVKFLRRNMYNIGKFCAER